jgi:hypothetical protein
MISRISLRVGAGAACCGNVILYLEMCKVSGNFQLGLWWWLMFDVHRKRFDCIIIYSIYT